MFSVESFKKSRVESAWTRAVKDGDKEKATLSVINNPSSFIPRSPFNLKLVYF